MRTPRSRFTRRAAKTVSVLALALASVLGGSAAYANFIPTVSASGSVSAGSLSVSVTGFANASMRNSDTSVAMPFTVTNTTTSASTQKATASIRLSSNHNVFPVSWVWPVANTAACPVNAAIGAGSSTIVWPAGASVSVDLAPGASQVYCLRTDRTKDVASIAGSITMSMTATATLKLGNFQASGQASASLSTVAVYPEAVPVDSWYRVRAQGQTPCFDVNGGSNASVGSGIGTYTCYASDDLAYSNQWFSFKQVTGGVAIRPKMPAGTSMQSNGTSVSVQTTNTGVVAQRWITQVVDTNVFQIVEASTGRCLTAPSSSGALTLSLCNNLNTQKFGLTKVNVATPTSGVIDSEEESVEEATTDEHQEGAPELAPESGIETETPLPADQFAGPESRLQQPGNATVIATLTRPSDAA